MRAFCRRSTLNRIIALAFCIGAACSVFGVRPALADSPKIDVIDFWVDWKLYLNSEVTLTGGTIVGANADFAILNSSAGNIILRSPWKDKEEFRLVLKQCSELMGIQECKLSVVGTVYKSDVEDKPYLLWLSLSKAK